MEHSEHDRPLGSTSTFWIGAALVAAACAALLYALGPYLPDVTYLIMVNERMFEGDRLYVDVRDINPPFSIWLYTPYVVLQNLTGISAYVWIGFGLTLCLVASLLLIDYLLREGLNVPVQRARRAALYIALIALIIMPTQFAQREHFCTIAALPWLFLLGARVETGFRPSRAMTILIGVFASALLILKPHYALGYGLPLLFLAWRRKDWRLLFVPEALVIALMVPVYWTIAYFAAPGFFTEMLPIGMTVYQIQFASTQHLLLMGTLINLPALLVVYWIMRTNRSANSITILLLVSSLGFVVAYILQGKGWPYHQLPAAITILSAAIYESITQDGPRSLTRLRKIGRTLIVAIVLFIGLFTGVVLGLQGYYTLVRFGSEGLLGPAVAFTLIRELGPVLTALMVVGQAGSALAAELGAQRHSERIDYLSTTTVPPRGYLVGHRLLAAVVCFPMLTAFFDLVGILGGYITGVFLLHVDGGVLLQN